jgi:hypothetical protein
MRLLEREPGISILPVFVVALYWKIDIIAQDGTKSAECPTPAVSGRK